MKKLILLLLLLAAVCVYAGPPAPAPHTIYDPGSVAITGGTINGTVIGGTTGADATFQDQVNLKDGTDTHTIKAVQETGLGGRLTFGLDETARTMVICDVGDIDSDLGLSAQAAPSFYIFNAAGTVYSRFQADQVYSSEPTGAYTIFTAGAGGFVTNGQVNTFTIGTDKPSGNANTFNSAANIELTDTDGEQSWLYIEPKINQSSTGAYNGLQIKVTETATGDGSTGTGATNNLIVAGTSGDPDMFKVDNSGNASLTATDATLGIGGAAGTQVQVVGASAYLTLQNSTAENTDGGAETRIIFEDHANAALAQIQGSHDGAADDTKGDLIFYTHTGSALTEAMRIDSSQLLQIGDAAAGSGNVNIKPGSAIAGLYIDQDNNAHGLEIDKEGSEWAMVINTASNGLLFTADGADGTPFLVRRTANSAESNPLAKFGSEHASTTQPSVLIDHDGTGGATGYALHIDSENAAGPALQVESANAIGINLESGNLAIGSPTANGNLAGGLIIKNGTAASAAVTDGVQIFSVDDAGSTATLGLYLENAVDAEADETKFSHKLEVVINGATYYIMLTDS